MAIDTNINEALLKDLMSIYNEAEQVMAKKVAKRIAKGITETGWNEETLSSVQGLKEEIESTLLNSTKMAESKVSKGILTAYKQGVNSAEIDLGKNQTLMKDLFISQPLQSLVLDTNKLLTNTHVQVLRNVDDNFRKIQAEASSMVLTGVETRLQATQRMMNKFASSGITSFIDKSGRTWNLGSYAEMAVRTNTAHAALQGHIDRQLELGEDLVRVSSLGTTCPLCGPWQGVILSISGKTEGYLTVDQARLAGLFHPNCKHTLSAYFAALDGKGKTELNDNKYTKETAKKYELTQQQRANERNIRYWKHRESLALNDGERIYCGKKLRQHQAINLQFCDINNLDRKYYREGFTKAQANAMVGPVIGNLKEYEDVYKSIIGGSPKVQFFHKYNLQFFAEAQSKPAYEKWLKAEIKSLDDLVYDKKNDSLTKVYNKYIGDTPSKDFKALNISDTTYAKWLKEQVSDIGQGYQIKPEVIQKVVNIDKGLSPTEVYKKFIGGSPIKDYKASGVTDKSYAKWLSEKADYAKKNMPAPSLFGDETFIPAPAPFENKVLQKQANTISNTKQNLTNAKLIEYKKELDDKVTGYYTASQEVKKAALELDTTKGEDYWIAIDKYEMAKSKDLGIHKTKTKELLSSAKSKSEIMSDINKMIEDFEYGLEVGNQDLKIKAHVSGKLKIWEDAKKEYINILDKQKTDMMFKTDALAIKSSGLKSKISLTKLTEEEADKLVKEITKMPHNSEELNRTKIHDVWKHIKESDGKAADKLVKKWMEKESQGVSMDAIQDLMQSDAKASWNKKDLKHLYSAYDYTHASGVYNRYKWGQIDDYATSNLHPHGKGKTGFEYGKEWSEHFDGFFDKISPVEDSFNVKRLVEYDGLAPMLGLDPAASQSAINSAIDFVNNSKGMVQIANSGYSSTATYFEGAWHGNVAMAIKVNKGTKALYGEAFSHYQKGHELETLLKANQPIRAIKVLKKGDKGFKEGLDALGYDDYEVKHLVICETIPD